MLAASPNDLSLISGTHIVEKRTDSPKLSSDHTHAGVSACASSEQV